LKKIIIITGNELRHEYFRKKIALEKDIEVVKSYCEVPVKNLAQKIKEDGNDAIRQEHLAIRQQTEIDFFEVFCQKILDESHPEFIIKGAINLEDKVEEIVKINPDLIISFGCCIIREPLISKFKKRFVNVHLGLSPYYRGSGTNFFPFVNKQVEYVGVTFMHIDLGVDTGEIIHQIRPIIMLGDNLHQIGNRLIKEMTETAIKLIFNFEKLIVIAPVNIDVNNQKYYKKSDFSEESVLKMYANFSSGLVKEYICNKQKLENNVKIIENPILV
jgi:hypothetical protein